MVILMHCSCVHQGALIVAENKVQPFRVAHPLDAGISQKNLSSAEDELVEDSVGDRRAGGCAASRFKANFAW
jgi:hypothetical protein